MPDATLGYRGISARLERRIRAGEYPVGEVLPSERRLAEEFGVARGTIRRALDHLVAEHHLLSLRGRHWYVHAPTEPQSLDVLRSFGQWALAAGMEPAGLTVRLARGRATGLEASALGLRVRDPVLRVVRVQSLGERPVMVKRATFPGAIGEKIEAFPLDARSYMEIMEADHGIRLGHAHHRILAIGANAEDARLLGVQRGKPLLRVVRVGRGLDGLALEYSDDRYDSDAVELSIVNLA